MNSFCFMLLTNQYKNPQSFAVEKLLRVLLQQIASVGDCPLQRHWAAALLSPIGAFLERGGIYPHFGTCGSGECSCDIVDWTVGITKSYALKAVRAVVQSDRGIRYWKHTREALHLGAVLSATIPGDHSTQDRWNPSYRGHHDGFSFDINQSRWIEDFLNYHYGVCDDVAIADMFFMLSQSRGIEEWADLSWFVDALAHAMQHSTMCVRHSALQVTFRMRRTLASLPVIQPLLPGLYAIVLNNDDTAYPFDEIMMRYLWILYAFTLYHNHIWATNLFQTEHFEQCCKLTLVYSRRSRRSLHPLYLIAIMDILEVRNTQCNFRNSIDQNLCFEILSHAWWTVYFAVDENRARNVEDLTLQVESGWEMLDELLLHLIAFTTRYHNTHSSVMAKWAYNYLPGQVLRGLQQTVPESLAITLMQELISNITTFTMPP
ncbi:hypothetical protein BJ138DRAFT_811116 [Hygrophoropsis aurantiaca]|uniref:Uncharacterized protein n=1 Tax=Hygrophoropsis aurantiaca TaxID=72124 RepID=A0ACB7ZW24_9AGAM|nr:hypothetical protein BJ138DRAFT_811116 [Hygrophoropsis aurantiaca]